MRTLFVTTPQGRLSPASSRRIVPNKLSGWQIERVPSGALQTRTLVPDVTLVQLSDDTQPAEMEAIMPVLVHLQAKAAKRPKRAYILFSVKQEVPKSKKHPVRPNAAANRRHSILSRISHYLQAFPQPDLVNLTFASTPGALATELDHIRAKLDLSVDVGERATSAAPPRPSPLDKIKELLKTTGDLRVEGGNLSAIAVADAFGLSINQLATWLGRSRQALGKTPDADSLQNDLSIFERVARLRAVMGQEDFLKWLRMPNLELDNRTPLALLKEGERQVVADLVDDILTGAPA